MKKRGKVIFGGDQHGRVIGGGELSLEPSLSIDNVLLVNNRKHNLLSKSQLFDSRCDVVLNNDQCIEKNKDETKIFTTNKESNLF